MPNTLEYAFRITHIDNISHIERCGFVRANSPLKDPNYVSIGDQQVIDIRANRKVKGHYLNKYIPFYLGPRSPMLYVIQYGYNGVRRVDAENIVYCVIHLADLIQNNVDCIFTDGHALSAFTLFYDNQSLPAINEIVRYNDVYSLRWSLDTDTDLKRRKEAELLVKNDLQPQYVREYIVYNETARQHLLNNGVAPQKVLIEPKYYF